MLIYLGFAALAAFASALVLSLLGEISLLATTHLVFAAAALPLIFGAISHFMPVLTRTGEAPRAVLLVPFLLQVAGLLAFLYFRGAVATTVLHAAAGTALLVALAYAGWLLARARKTFGTPHPGWRWYFAAVVFLAFGLALVPAMDYWPQWRLALRLLHVHFNLLGFVGLTAIGTLQVLLPTVLSGPDAEATQRLRTDLPWAVGGVLATSLGAAFWWPLSLAGAAMLFCVVWHLGSAWYSRYGLLTLLADGAAAALVAALFGFVLFLLIGVAHAFGLLSGHDAVPGFMAAFLLPLVSGALSQLLPVWRFPGKATPERARMRDLLASGGLVRALFFIASGFLLALGYEEGFWLAAVGLLHFGAVLVRAYFFSAPIGIE